MSCEYDVIVIGSGIGGLTAALAAARKGRSVLVLEAGKQFGGYLNPFQRGKFHFDPGLHYIGESGPEGRFTQLLQALGLEELSFNEVGVESGFDQYVFPNCSVINTRGLHNFRDRLVAQFPQETDAIHRFFRFMKKADAAMSVAMKLKGPLSFVKAAPQLPFLLRWKNATLKEMLDHFFRDPDLKAVMAGPCGDIGLPPGKLHGFVHLGILLHYAGGAYFPKGGTKHMRDTYVHHLKEYGAVLKRRTVVDRIFTRRGRAVGVKTENGECYYGRSVISNIQADLTFKMVDPAILPPSLVEKCENLELSPGSVCVFLGVKNTCDLSKIGDKNIWHYSTNDIDGLYRDIQSGAPPDGSSFFLSCPSRKDPEGCHAPEGHSVVEIVTLSDQKPFKKWADLPTMKRGEDYQQFKEAIADRLIEAAEKYIPGLKDAIVIKEVSTPNTNVAFVKAPHGNIYGPAQAPSQSGPSRFPVKTPVPGLFLCGASVVSAGILPCAASGFWAGKAAHRYLEKLPVPGPKALDPQLSGETYVARICRHAQNKGDVPALFHKVEGAWRSLTWKDYEVSMRRVARSLMALGFEKGHCACIAAGNRPEWVLAQMGVMAAGGVTSSLYLTNTAKQNAYILQHCRARILFVENAEQYGKVMAHRSNLPHLEKVVCMDLVSDADPGFAMSWEQFLEYGEGCEPEKVDECMAGLKPDEPAMLIYTSGTTGHPKAVIITHRNLDHMGKALLGRFTIKEYRVISFLPLCHIAEQSATNTCHLATGGQVYFCKEIDQLKDCLIEAMPTIFFAVPRIWEKLEAALRERFAGLSPFKRNLVHWALKVEGAAFHKELKTGKPVGGSSRWAARKWVIEPLRAKLGLDRLTTGLSGSAPISAETQNFFASIGLPLVEVYGLSESTGILATTLPNYLKPGCVGVPIDGVSLKLADDGEILCRGPVTTPGYLYDEERTAMLWNRGWMHTGDLGRYDEEGNLVITGRKKDIIITAGGKKVAPQAIESRMNALPFVAQSLVVGDARPYLTAFIAIDPKGAASMAKKLGIFDASPKTLVDNEQFKDLAQREIDRIVNSALARYETVKHVRLFPEPFSIAAGEITPTLKLRRNVVYERYSQEIEALYG